VLLCNLAGHYKAGQFVAFTVEGDASDSAVVTPEEPAPDAQAADAAVKGTAVALQLGENGNKYFVKVDKNAVPAGTTTFVIDNVGTMHHELAVYKTEIAPGKLPLTDEGKVDEEKAGLVAEAVYTGRAVTKTTGSATGAASTYDHPARQVRAVQPGGPLQGGQYIGFTVS
jgi:uncharacterized cupredoxin-like copper-binding protein